MAVLGYHILKEFGAELGEGFTPETIREAGLDLRLEEPLYLRAKEFKLGLTMEVIKLSNTQIGFCNLRSTWARRGLIIPPTIVDPGFGGKLVIEVFNAGDGPIVIPANERFLHLVIALCTGAKSYNGQYQGQFLEVANG
jgi:dCTP deaminase